MNIENILASLVVCVGLVSASCSGGGDDNPSSPPPPSFSGDSLVLDSLQHTSDASEPTAINGQELTFSEDPHAFDSAFQ